MWYRTVRPEPCEHFSQKTCPFCAGGDHFLVLLGMVINRVAPGKLGPYPLEAFFEAHQHCREFILFCIIIHGSHTPRIGHMLDKSGTTVVGSRAARSFRNKRCSENPAMHA